MSAARAARVRQSMLQHAHDLDAGQVRDAVRASGLVLDDVSIEQLRLSLVADLQGYGPLQPLLADPGVTDIVVNGAHDVWVDRGDGMVRSPITFSSDDDVRRVAHRLAVSCGRRLDDAMPFVDAPLAHGVRMHAMLPPLVERISMSLRIPRHRSWSLPQLAASGMVDPHVERALRDLIARRATFLVTGGTGSGKTTLLNALLGLVDPAERIVVVEDTRELMPEHPHVVSAQTKPANIEGAGAVTLRDLVRQTLRMRPDRIVVGEVRGPEVVDLLTAFNTGHRGGCGTVHANSAADVLNRLVALGALAGLPRDSVLALAGSAIEAVVHVERGADGMRRVAEIATVLLADGAPKVRAT